MFLGKSLSADVHPDAPIKQGTLDELIELPDENELTLCLFLWNKMLGR